MTRTDPVLLFNEIEDTTINSTPISINNSFDHYDELQLYINITGTGTAVWKIDLFGAFDENDDFVEHYTARCGVVLQSTTGNISKSRSINFECMNIYMKIQATLISPPEEGKTSKLTLKYMKLNKN